MLSHKKMQAGDKAPDFFFQTPWSSRHSFYETAGNNPAILVFLRYLGCPVCQMEMARLKREIGLFTQKETGVFVFLQSAPATVASAAKERDWHFFVVCDPQGNIFRMYSVESGGILKYLHPAGLVAAVKSVGQGFRHGKFEGRETQLPAVFTVSAGKIIMHAHYGRHISDIPLPATMAANME
jgi:peroxiredoxin